MSLFRPFLFQHHTHGVTAVPGPDTIVYQIPAGEIWVVDQIRWATYLANNGAPGAAWSMRWVDPTPIVGGFRTLIQQNVATAGDTVYGSMLPGEYTDVNTADRLYWTEDDEIHFRESLGNALNVLHYDFIMRGVIIE